MGRYLLRRIAGLAATLLVLLVGVFAAVHAVPALAPAAVDSADTAWLEANREFRRQYGLDLPVFLNTRWRVSEERVLEELRRTYDAPTDAERLQAREWVSDHVPFAPLVFARIAASERVDPRTRRAAARALAERASDLPSPFPGAQAPLEEWRSWLERHGRSLELSSLEALRTTFLETRWSRFLGNVVRLDFGRSMRDRRPVAETLLQRLRNTVWLTSAAVLLAYLLSVPLGAWLGLHRGTKREGVVSGFLLLLYSVPTYVAASLLVQVFALGRPFDWFPVGGLHTMKGYESMGAWQRLADRAAHLVLPLACLTYGSLAVLSRYGRDSVAAALRAPYVRLARAKGLPPGAVLRRHGLRNGLLPLLTLLGEALPALFGGSVIVEILFEIPGMGTYVYESIRDADYNAVLACTLFYGALTLLGFLLSDVLYAWADPRIRDRWEEAS